jgi:hypothetical protein
MEIRIIRSSRGQALARLLFLSLCFTALAFVTAGQERYPKPIDDAESDPEFLAFRGKVLAAAERKDAKFIYSIVDSAILNGFGGRNGIAWFKRDWKLESANSQFWPKFLAVIRNGGSFQGEGDKKRNSFVAPYVYSNWPEDLDSFEYFAIFGSDVNLRKTPSTDGEIVGKLSYNLVRIKPETLPKSGRSEYPGWKHVRTLGGLEGFVKEDYVRSSVDYRAGFEKKRGRWVMTFFLAGD